MKTREIQARRAHHRIFFQHLVLAVSLAFVTGQAGATHNSHHNPNGPRASLLSSTTCAIDYGTGELVVTTILANKSSGASVPEVRSGTISGTYKQADEPGNMIFTLGGKMLSELATLPVDVDPTLTITAPFSLCDGTNVSAQVLSARELNGDSVINYGISDGSEDPHTVHNRCTADDTGVGGGIKVADVIDAITTACSMQTP